MDTLYATHPHLNNHFVGNFRGDSVKRNAWSTAIICPSSLVVQLFVDILWERHCSNLPVCRQSLQPRQNMKLLSFTTLVLTSATHAQNVSRGAAMMRFACSQLTVERLDPLVNPGVVGSPHTHQIVGGNSFQPDMKPEEYDMVEKSTCTTCTFSEDFRCVTKVIKT
jgi:hypothetical protein